MMLSDLPEKFWAESDVRMDLLGSKKRHLVMITKLNPIQEYQSIEIKTVTTTAVQITTSLTQKTEFYGMNHFENNRIKVNSNEKLDAE